MNLVNLSSHSPLIGPVFPWPLVVLSVSSKATRSLIGYRQEVLSEAPALAS